MHTPRYYGCMHTTETWRWVAGYAGRYEISTEGRMRSHIGKRPRLLALAIDGRGRRGVFLYNGVRGGVVHRMVHILVLETFVGPRPEGMYACRNNGDALDNRLSNLRWDTPRENALDTVRHGMNRFANRIECPRGHMLAEPNLRRARMAKGSRNCLACHRAYAVWYRAQRRGEGLDLQALSDDYYASIMGGTAAA